MASVYIETTIPSYLAARRSRDLIVAAHQQVTHEWWDTKRSEYELYVSEFVLDEVRSGNPTYIAERLKLVSGLQVLQFSSEVEELVRFDAEGLGLTGPARSDVPHFAYSVAYNMEHVLTWNCAHIANGHVIRKLSELNSNLGRRTPIIVTPEELLTHYLEVDP
jgi:hypothetical protein